MSILAITIATVLAVTTTALTPAQQDDLACVGASRTLAQGHESHDAMARFFLSRLKKTDANRDWLAEAPDYGNLKYRDFMAVVNGCQIKMRRPSPNVR